MGKRKRSKKSKSRSKTSKTNTEDIYIVTQPNSNQSDSSKLDLAKPYTSQDMENVTTNSSSVRSFVNDVILRSKNYQSTRKFVECIIRESKKRNIITNDTLKHILSSEPKVIPPLPPKPPSNSLLRTTVISNDGSNFLSNITSQRNRLKRIEFIEQKQETIPESHDVLLALTVKNKKLKKVDLEEWNKQKEELKKKEEESNPTVLSQIRRGKKLRAVPKKEKEDKKENGCFVM